MKIHPCLFRDDWGESFHLLIDFFFFFNFDPKELLDGSFEPWCINCFLGCRGRNASKQTVGSSDFSCFIRIFLSKFHRAPFWTSDVLLACFINAGTSALMLPVSVLCHTASALLCSVLLGYSGAGGDHAPSVATKEEMPCVKLEGFHWGHTT